MERACSGHHHAHGDDHHQTSHHGEGPG
jgi:hypothetical protein